MIFRHIKKLISQRPTFDMSSISPDEHFYVIGDIHGRFDLLQMLLPGLEPDKTLVFVGDYIDRGRNSAQVLRHLHALSQKADRHVVCLKGNHEDMLLSFLDHPAEAARMWLFNGGDRTLASFGVEHEQTDFAQMAQELQKAMGHPLLDWLADLPLHWTSGNITVVHAALDPSKTIEHQSQNVCLWGHARFRERPRRDGQWVAHGHTIVTDPQAANGIISVDTGAFVTDHLTAAEISPGRVQFISTGVNGLIRL